LRDHAVYAGGHIELQVRRPDAFRKRPQISTKAAGISSFGQKEIDILQKMAAAIFETRKYPGHDRSEMRAFHNCDLRAHRPRLPEKIGQNSVSAIRLVPRRRRPASTGGHKSQVEREVKYVLISEPRPSPSLAVAVVVETTRRMPRKFLVQKRPLAGHGPKKRSHGNSHDPKSLDRCPEIKMRCGTRPDAHHPRG